MRQEIPKYLWGAAVASKTGNFEPFIASDIGIVTPAVGAPVVMCFLNQRYRGVRASRRLRRANGGGRHDGGRRPSRDELKEEGNSDMRLTNKVAVVTGAHRGIGYAIAEALAREGAAVLPSISSRSRPHSFPRNHIPGDGCRLGGSLDSGRARLRKDHGRIDILVNAAGVTSGTAAVHEVKLADWDHIIAVNQTGVMLGMQMAIGMMLGRGGSIVNIASIWGLVGAPGQIAYHASKAAVMGMSRNAAINYATEGYA